MPKRIRIIHHTEYHYREPVTFGLHRALLRPREGHDLHIVSLSVDISPEPMIEWLRDIYGNSIALLRFSEPSKVLRIHSEAEVDLYLGESPACPISSTAKTYPFQYGADEQVEIVPYRLPSYPHDGALIQAWLAEIYQPGPPTDTMELLTRLNTAIFKAFKYIARDEHGVQLPCETLAKGSGSCRDYAVFMMEAARHWGFAARFVTGYIQLGAEQHGATHAWTEIYLPGAGWQGFDPTNNKLDGNEHVAVAVAREQEKAAPLSGSWAGPSDAYDRMEVSVQVIAV